MQIVPYICFIYVLYMFYICFILCFIYVLYYVYDLLKHVRNRFISVY